jgi:peptidoglycan/LPS O-acetylase OafA/YrhL
MFTSPFATLLLPAYSPFFIAGMLFYLLQQNMGKAKQLYGLLLVLWVLGIRHSLAHATWDAQYYHTSFSPLVIGALISLFYILFLLIIRGKVNLHRYKWLSWLGSLTYPLYLLHHNLGFILFQRLGGKLDKYVLLIGIILFMLLLSYLLHVYVEKRFTPYLRGGINNQLNRLNRAVSSQ